MVTVEVVIGVAQETVVCTNNKRMQEVIIADITCAKKSTLWENDVGTLQEGKYYKLCNFMVREYYIGRAWLPRSWARRLPSRSWV